MVEKVTVMRLKVDLQCPCCYKKVKKILCKFPEIRDQVYDEKQNLVTITVVCSCPEKIRAKLCCKGGKVIKSIEIVDPGKPQEPKPVEKPPVPEKPKKEPKPDKKEPKPDEKPPVPEKPKKEHKPDKKEPKPDEKPPVPEKPKPKPDEKPPAPENPKPCWHPLVPVVFRCVPCLEGYGGGPCYCGYWRPMPLPRCNGSYGHGCGCGCGCRYGYGKGYWYSWCDY